MEPRPGTRELKFPVIGISGPAVDVFHGVDDLTSWSSTSLRRGYGRELYLVDAELRGFAVVEAEKVGGIGPLWGIRLDRRRIRVRLELGPEERLRIEDVKRRIREAIEREPDHWEAAISWEDHRDRLAEVDGFDALVKWLLWDDEN